MSWSTISENVMSGIIGAIVLSCIYWLAPRLAKRKPVIWYEIASGYTELENNSYTNSVAYSVVELKNRTRNVLKNVEVLVSSDFDHVSLPSGTKFELKKGDTDNRILIFAMQPQQRLSLEVQKVSGHRIRVEKVFVGDEDMGDYEFHKVVPKDAIVLPNGVLFPFFILIGPAVFVIFAVISSIFAEPQSVNDTASDDGSALNQPSTDSSDGLPE